MIVNVNLLPTNESVTEKNDTYLRERGNPIVWISARDEPNVMIHDSETCLPSQLYLSIGCRVMLCNNTGGLVQ